jgi:hypothetical protein
LEETPEIAQSPIPFAELLMPGRISQRCDLVPANVFKAAAYGAMKRPARKAAARRDNSMLLLSNEHCMVVGETGGRKCERCGGQPDILHVPYRGKGAFCPGCCPCSAESA